MNSDKPKTLYLIDGMSQLFRAYFAPAAFRNRGKGMGAAYIFVRMCLKLIQRGNPDLLICAMDSRGEVGIRTAIFPAYKAHRDPMPEDMAEAMPVVMELLDGLGIPVIEGGDYEADDVIGTLAKQADEKGWQVRIISRDKDLKQLLSKRVALFDPDDGSMYGPDELEIDLGIKPEQFIDYLTLMGDTSDGIPGAKGIGPKTAQALIQEYGTLEAVLEQADQIPQKARRENLIAFREQAPVSKELATIRLDMPLDFKLDGKSYGGPVKEKLLPLLQQHSFRAIITDLGWSDGTDGDSPAEGKSADKTEAKPAAKSADKPARKGRKSSSSASAGGGMFDAQAEDEAAADDGGEVVNRYTLVNTAKALKDFAKQLAKQKRFAFDTETTGLDPLKDELVGLSFSWGEGEGYYLPVKGPKSAEVLKLEDTLTAIRGPLEDPKVGKIGQNAKFDMLVLRRHGIVVRGLAFDTMIGAYLSDNTRQQVSLDQLAQEYLGYSTIQITALIGADKKSQITMDKVALSKICDYAAEDADIALRLAGEIEPELKEKGIDRLANELEMPLVEVLAAMEWHGIRIDVEYLNGLADDFGTRISEAEKACHEAAGRSFTVNSPKQLAEVLFDELNLPAQGKTGKGARTTNEEALEALSQFHPLPAHVLRYRHLSKLKSTYIDALPTMVDQNNRVHTSFRQAVSTGRIASTDPNVQNIPVRSEEGRKIRRAFIADPKHRLVVADYSQIELRILAHLSEDPTMCQAFNDGRDIHRAVAAEVNGVAEDKVDSEMRAHVKAIHFGILYGQSAFRLSQNLGIPHKEAQGFIDRYFDRFPTVRQFITQSHDEVMRTGMVSTIMGRVRHIDGAQDRNRARQSAALRQAFNTVVQGSAADLIKSAMVRIHRAIEAKQHPWKMLIQVHDELVFETPADKVEECAEFVRREMGAAMELRVPLVVDLGTGENWLDAK